MNDVAFYDDLYTKFPDKWRDDDRNSIAYGIVSQYISPKKVLDIGCGNGHTLAYFKSQNSEVELYGLDLSPVAVELARKKVPGAVIACGDFMELDIQPVDVAILMGVAEHFQFLIPFFDKLSTICRYAYIESPDCLRYSPYEEEGFRVTWNGAGQKEWHLERESWEFYIRPKFDIHASIKGTIMFSEFIWVLKSKMFDEIGHPAMDEDMVVPR